MSNIQAFFKPAFLWGFFMLFLGCISVLPCEGAEGVKRVATPKAVGVGASSSSQQVPVSKPKFDLKATLDLETATEAETEPVAKPVVEPVAEPVVESVAEPVVEPISVPMITADLLLPETTCAYVSVRDFSVCRQAWQETSLGKLQKTPEMDAFFSDFQAQLKTRFSAVQSRLGVSLQEIGQIASGEIASGLLMLDHEKYGVVVIIDVGENQIETQSVLDRVAQRVTEDGGSRKQQECQGAQIFILNIIDKQTQKTHKAYYILKDGLLIASDSLETVKGVLNRLTVLQSESDEILPCLAQIDGYLRILDKCVVDAKLPDIIWYVDPLRYLDVQRMIQMETDAMNVSNVSVSEMLTKSGFNGIEAIGGVVTFRNAGYDATQRIFVSIPQPATLSLKMLKFPATEAFTIPKWIPEDVDSLHVVNIDFVNLIDNLGPLFNQFFGEGSDGIWEDILAGLKEDEYGPQIDLRNDLVAHFGNSVLIVSQNLEPKELDQSRKLIAVPLTSAKAVFYSFQKLLQDEPSFQTEKNEKGEVYWVFVPEEGLDEDEEAQQNAKMFPEMTITIWRGYLLIASHRDVLERMKAYDPQTTKSLVDSPLYLRIVAESEAFANGVPRSSFHYIDNARSRQHLYEMCKAGTIRESVSVSQGLLGSLFKDQPEGENAKPFDTSKLPDYSMIREYLMPAGGMLLNTKGGFLFQGFWMSMEQMEK